MYGGAVITRADHYYPLHGDAVDKALPPPP